MRKYFFFLLVFCLSSMSIWADDDETTVDDGTRVTNYVINMIVHQDNTYDVEELVTVNFPTPHHGFYRYVPNVYYMFGKEYASEVNEIDVKDEPFELSTENSNTLIKIGDADRTITGSKTYKISYHIGNYDDRISEYDIFYHSVIGEYFKLPIKLLQFTITFEKALPAGSDKNLAVFSGPSGNAGNALNAVVKLEGNTIKGMVKNIPIENAVTLQLKLPQGYFVGTKTITSTNAYVSLFVVILLLCMIFFYEFFAHHPSITKQIEFYPPDGMCSAEVGTVIDDCVDDIDLASLIPWFACEGYLKIEEKEEKGLLSKSKYLEISKLKDANPNWKEYQKVFFNALFQEKSKGVRLDKMPDVSEEVSKSKKGLEDLFTGEHKLVNWHWAVYLLFPLLIATSFFFVFALPYDGWITDDFFVVVLIWCIPAFLGACWVLPGAAGRLFNKGMWKKIFLLFRFIVMLGVMALQMALYDDLLVDQTIVVIVYIACFFAVESAVRLNIDTEYRASLIGKLLGLKEFIKTAEEPRLKSLLQDDPHYFYKILPYAMVFEISDVWANHFRNIQMDQPDWFSSSSAGSAFMASSFVSSVSSATSSAITCMSPSSSSSGGGGGFSGGGSGGGGGGAW